MFRVADGQNPIVAGQGTRRDPPRTGCPPLTGLMHPHSLRLGPHRHTSAPDTHTLGTWEETRALRRIPETMGRTYRLHPDSGPAQESDVLSAYNEMLFENLLYTVFHHVSGQLDRGRESFPPSNDTLECSLNIEPVEGV